ncbi:Transcription factor himD like protein [Verticillium longisporum]|nr:Transcription factor himD like protein [Verticillium longisporum]
MESVSDGTPAPYGRACTNCAKAKCKCTLRSVGGACERCHRLSKTCQPAPSVRKRSKKQVNSRTAHLEKKLDHLAVLLRASGHGNLSADLESSVSGDPASLTEGSTTPYEDAPYASTSQFTNPLCQGTSASSTQVHGGIYSYSLTSGPEPTQQEAELLFINFRDVHLRYFPFVDLSQYASALQMRQERPFLWLCIMAISTRSRPLQLDMSERIRWIISQKLMMEHERNMDYLLGLIAFMAWINVQPGSKPFFCFYTQLAIALVYDLGLTKELSKFSTPLLYWKSIGLNNPYSAVSPPRTMEERRTVLAAYLLSATVASFVKKMDSMRWTKHMDDCLDVLEKSKVIPNDRTLIAMVRMQLIHDEAISIYSPRDAMGWAAPPPTLYIKALYSKLHAVYQALAPEVKANDIVACRLHDTELAIHESAISQAHSPTNFPNTQRLEALFACLNSIKSWFDLALVIPLSTCPDYGLTFFAQMSHCAINLHRLQTMDDPIWDIATARTIIDLPQVLEKLAVRCTVAADLATASPNDNEEFTFVRAAKMLRMMKSFWEKDMTERMAKARREATGLPTPATQGTSVPLDGVELADFDGELLDDEWFAHVFTPMDL